MSKFEPGDKIIIKVNGRSYETVIDQHGVQRFVVNPFFRALVDDGIVDLNQLALTSYKSPFRKDPEWMRAYAEFNMGLGYSVSGWCDLSHFEDWPVENPVWE